MSRNVEVSNITGYRGRGACLLRVDNTILHLDLRKVESGWIATLDDPEPINLIATRTSPQKTRRDAALAFAEFIPE